MANVHDLSVGSDIEDDSLKDSHEVIVKPEVGGQRDEWPMRQFPLAKDRVVHGYSVRDVGSTVESRYGSNGRRSLAHIRSPLAEEPGMPPEFQPKAS